MWTGNGCVRKLEKRSLKRKINENFKVIQNQTKKHNNNIVYEICDDRIHKSFPNNKRLWETKLCFSH